MKTYHYWEDNKIYKAGEILDVDYDHYRELIDTGIAKPYVKPPIKAPTIVSGTCCVEIVKSTPEYKCGDIVTMDNEQAFLLGLKGVVVPATQDCEKTKATKYVLKCRIVDILKVLDKHKVTVTETAASCDARALLFWVQTLLSSGEIKPNEILELPEYEGMGSLGWTINQAYNW
jgi:hypothetical protein